MSNGDLSAATNLAPAFPMASPRAVVQHDGVSGSSVLNPGIYRGMIKSVIDVLGAAVLLIILAPLLALAACVVRVDTGAPALFRQTRIGRHGVPFTIYKLRTMHDDPELAQSRLVPGADGRIVHKTADDPRITSSGKVLRKFSIDELPQLWNVLCGQMSLVGPRPELPAIVEAYEPWQQRRHVVKPGLTGLWQVLQRSDGLMHEHTELDLEYVETLSLIGDVKLLLWTVPAALGRRPGI